MVRDRPNSPAKLEFKPFWNARKIAILVRFLALFRRLSLTYATFSCRAHVDGKHFSLPYIFHVRNFGTELLPQGPSEVLHNTKGIIRT